VALKRIVRIEIEDIPAGSFKDYKYAPEVDLNIKKIVVVDAYGGSLNNVYATIKFGDEPITYPDVSLALFDPKNPANPDIDRVLKASVFLNGRITNASNSTVKPVIMLICTE